MALFLLYTNFIIEEISVCDRLISRFYKEIYVCFMICTFKVMVYCRKNYHMDMSVTRRNTNEFKWIKNMELGVYLPQLLRVFVGLIDESIGQLIDSYYVSFMVISYMCLIAYLIDDSVSQNRFTFNLINYGYYDDLYDYTEAEDIMLEVMNMNRDPQSNYDLDKNKEMYDKKINYKLLNKNGLANSVLCIRGERTCPICLDPVCLEFDPDNLSTISQFEFYHIDEKMIEEYEMRELSRYDLVEREHKYKGYVEKDDGKGSDVVHSAVTICGHYFHMTCLLNSIKIQNKHTCPICSRDVITVINGNK